MNDDVPQILQDWWAWCNAHPHALDTVAKRPAAVIDHLWAVIQQLKAPPVIDDGPVIVKHRSGCAAWTADHSQRWQAGDEAACNCGAMLIAPDHPHPCYRCGVATMLSTAWCQKCLDYGDEYRKRYTQTRKCPLCGKPLGQTLHRCAPKPLHPRRFFRQRVK